MFLVKHKLLKVNMYCRARKCIKYVFLFVCENFVTLERHIRLGILSLSCWIQCEMKPGSAVIKSHFTPSNSTWAFLTDPNISFIWPTLTGFHHEGLVLDVTYFLTLTPPDTWSCPMLRPFSPELVMFSDFEFRTSLGTSILPYSKNKIEVPNDVRKSMSGNAHRMNDQLWVNIFKPPFIQL